MAVVTMKNLLESGVHFGHQVKRWDPRMNATESTSSTCRKLLLQSKTATKL